MEEGVNVNNVVVVVIKILVPTQNLRIVIGIDLLLFSIVWYKGGDVQSKTKIGASFRNCP